MSQLCEFWAARVRVWKEGVSDALPSFGLPDSGRRKWRLPRFRLKVILLIAIGAAVTVELSTGWLQSRLWTALASRSSYEVKPGPSPAMPLAADGPFDSRMGYAKLPAFQESLEAEGFIIGSQARSSPAMVALSRLGFYAPYREKVSAGLSILGRDGRPLLAAAFPGAAYQDFSEIPPVIVETLLFIENRELLTPTYAHENPAIEWARLGRAMLDLGMSRVGLTTQVSGGSTLATQLEKLRHSPGGRTGSVPEKLRQMASASVRAYRDGDDTIAARRQIVCDYINAMPLAAAPGHGEVTGLAEGLWVWFGTSAAEANRLLTTPDKNLDANGLGEKARVYREVLSLLLALKKPTAFLADRPAALDVRAEGFLPLLAEAGIISPALRDLALTARAVPRKRAPERTPASFADRKAADGIRAALLNWLNLDSAYDLDRLDLRVETTLDGASTQEVTRELQQLNDLEHAAKAGILGERLISRGRPEPVIYSFTLYERTPEGNLLRVQSDNYDQPLNINRGTKLELGSTAKLRTLATYLEIIAELHETYGGLAPERLRVEHVSREDRLTEWVIDYLLAARDKSLQSILAAAMERTYSANPGESFFTGGGLHTFRNFDSKDNGRIMTVREAFHRSVNLVFIRMMRDIVRYHMVRMGDHYPAILNDPNHPERQDYLKRFADEEGRLFLYRFWAKYRNMTGPEALDKLLSTTRLTPKRFAQIHRSAWPAATLEEFTGSLARYLPEARVTEKVIADLYETYGPGKFDWNDRGYLASVHPLELWLIAYLYEHPGAPWSEVASASAGERQHVYSWLFKTRHRAAQDKRILALLETDAFVPIHARWARLGFPFRSLVPSYATSIGSSGDNPDALAELMGIIVNDGWKYPAVRVTGAHLGEGTPFETNWVRQPAAPERVMAPEIARELRKALTGVVEHGTGRRAYGALKLPDGSMVTIGGKTGTGDNRIEMYGRGGRLIGSRVRNRTATFVFLIGDRFFGTITAFVPGDEAAQFAFTSALPVQVFRRLAQIVSPVVLEQPAGKPPAADPGVLITQGGVAGRTVLAAR